jgi:hypothetical protein
VSVNRIESADNRVMRTPQIDEIPMSPNLGRLITSTPAPAALVDGDDEIRPRDRAAPNVPIGGPTRDQPGGDIVATIEIGDRRAERPSRTRRCMRGEQTLNPCVNLCVNLAWRVLFRVSTETARTL